MESNPVIKKCFQGGPLYPFPLEPTHSRGAKHTVSARVHLQLLVARLLGVASESSQSRLEFESSSLRQHLYQPYHLQEASHLLSTRCRGLSAICFIVSVVVRPFVSHICG